MIAVLGSAWILSSHLSSHVLALEGDLIVIEGGESILVDDFSSSSGSDDQNLPRYDFNVRTINQISFTEEDIPRISIEDFMSSDDRGGIKFLSEEDSREYSFGASDWISGSQALINLDEQAVNELDFVLNIPNGRRPGTYTSALVFRNKADEKLGHYLIIVNIDRQGSGLTDPEIQLFEEDSKIDLEDGEAEIVLVNLSQWHVEAVVQITFVSEDDDGNKEYSELFLEQEKGNTGIFPDTRQIFSLPTDEEFFETLPSHDISEVELTVLDRRLAYELKNFDIIDLISEESNSQGSDPEEGDSKKPDKEEDEETPVAATASSDNSNSAGFYQDNIFLITMVVVLVLVAIATVSIVIFFKHREQQQMKLFVQGAKSDSGQPSTSAKVISTPSALGGMSDLPVIDDSPSDTGFDNQNPFN